MANGSWILNANGNWGTAANWSGGVIADGVGATGSFTNNISANRTVTLDSNITLGNFTVGDLAGADNEDFYFTNANGAVLTLDAGAGVQPHLWIAGGLNGFNIPFAGTNGFYLRPITSTIYNDGRRWYTPSTISGEIRIGPTNAWNPLFLGNFNSGTPAIFPNISKFSFDNAAGYTNGQLAYGGNVAYDEDAIFVSNTTGSDGLIYIYNAAGINFNTTGSHDFRGTLEVWGDGAINGLVSKVSYDKPNSLPSGSYVLLGSWNNSSTAGAYSQLSYNGTGSSTVSSIMIHGAGGSTYGEGRIYNNSTSPLTLPYIFSPNTTTKYLRLYSTNGGGGTIGDITRFSTEAFTAYISSSAGSSWDITGSLNIPNISITGGTTKLLSSSANLDSVAVSLDGGTLGFGDGVTARTLGSLAGSTNLVLTNSAGQNVNLTVGTLNSNTTYSGLLSGGGNITKTGTGYTWLTNNSSHSFSGSVNILSGGLEVNNNAFPNVTTPIAISSNAYVAIDPNQPQVTVPNDYTGLGRLTTQYTATGITNGLIFTGNLRNLNGTARPSTVQAWSGLELYGSSTSGYTLNKATVYNLPSVVTLRNNPFASGIPTTLSLYYTGSAEIYPTKLYVFRQSTVAGATYNLFANQPVGALELQGGIEKVGSVVAADTLNLDGISTADNKISGIISETTGTLAINKSGTGKWILSNANTHTAGTTVSAGTLQLDHNSASLNSTVAFNGGTLAFGNGITAPAFKGLSGTSTGTLFLTNSSGQPITLTVGNAGGVHTTFAGVIAGSGSTLIKTGSLYNIYMTGTSTLTGSLIVRDNGGIVINQGPSSVTGDKIPGVVDVLLQDPQSSYGQYSNNGHVVKQKFRGAGVASYVGGAGTTPYEFGPGSLSGLTGTLAPSAWWNSNIDPQNGLTLYTDAYAANAQRYIYAKFADFPSVLTYAAYANGSSIFPYFYTQYTGSAATYPTRIDINNIAAAATTYHASVNYQLDANQASGALILSGGIKRQGVAASTTATFTLGGTNTADNTLAGMIDENGKGPIGITKTGAGKWVLSVENNHSADTKPAAGTLEIQHSNALQSSSVNLATGDTGVLTFKNITNATFGSIYGTRNLALTNSAGQALTVLTIGGDNQTQTYTGVISGSTTDIYKVGTGTQTFGNGQLFRNIPSIFGGVTISADSGLGTDTTSNITLNNATLTNNSTAFSTNRNFTLASGTTNAINGPITINNAIVGGGNLSHTTGELVLSGANNIGAVTIAASSQITLANADALSGSGAITTNNGNTIKILQDTVIDRNIILTTPGSSVGPNLTFDTGRNKVILNGLLTGGAGTSWWSTLIFGSPGGYAEINNTNNTFSTQLIVAGNGGSDPSVLYIPSEAAIGNSRLSLEGNGILETSGSTFTRKVANTIPTSACMLGLGASNGFSSVNPSGTTITNGGLTLTFNGSYTNGYWEGLNIVFNTPRSLGPVKLSCGVNLNGGSVDFVINNGADINGSTTYIDGVIVGSTTAGILNKEGPGKLILSAKNTYIGATNVNSGTLEAKYIGLQYGNGVSTTGGTITAASGTTYRYVGSGSSTYATIDMSAGNNTLLIDGAAGACIDTIALSSTTIVSGTADQDKVIEVSSLYGSATFSGNNTWKLTNLMQERGLPTTLMSGSKLVLSTEKGIAIKSGFSFWIPGSPRPDVSKVPSLGSGSLEVKAGATLETHTGEFQNGKVFYKGNITLGTVGSGELKAKYKIGNGPVKDAGATIVNGNLTFTAVTNLQLNNATIFNTPGEYIIFKYTGTCTGFEYLNPSTNVAGRLVSHMRHDSINKRIYVTLS